jgi:8-oxo-dGTP pyrophosphatase MutT (NUDIX family)
MLPETIKAACVCLVNSESGTVLTVSRKNNKQVFTMPGGKCEPGESFIDCANRELEEETGYKNKHCSPSVFFEDFHFNQEKPGTVYYCKTILMIFHPDLFDLVPVGEHETGIIKWQSPNILVHPTNPLLDYNLKFFEEFKCHAKYWFKKEHYDLLV